jgi:hypothetical protein
MAAVESRLGELTLAIKAITANTAQISKEPEAVTTVRLVRDQYARLEHATTQFSRMVGNPGAKEDLSKRLLADLDLALSNAHVERQPGGNALVLKLGPNRFRVLFPVPMRIPPNVAFADLPPGVIPNISDHSNIGFSVVFTPASILVDKFGFTASAEILGA